ncbi:MAG: hypothetical protein ABF461_07605 [Zymomonas mobilis subsp. pomaceae]|uniref:Transmembrane protein n=1 Tax=Zymomonas mobilis subsp. pomaceae (strain ATCC 29192 / DSM 22645 / JCM 10191 / CCUG 17912 / NBRC 13757 / NCIMB 11200 / NRRL B-4491 / Barker I) TaxID=579138 RepID=F8EV65_ZYMMT|nr:hypothetical protein [Zymomonas mobilis]AEI38283.1 hypothetical protein Zymop_1393 [Zymomonas mobilis subsp. pomaceae ATCC 29192]MDX5947972.1 hypothetical protein [Zymomonas mobilis subsp. pomaceae]GEB89301.1 hypothetical protein ZMO02_09380 [Zymomonas mobilis subsp. pomaceae]
MTSSECPNPNIDTLSSQMAAAGSEIDPYETLDPHAKAQAIHRFHLQKLFLIILGAIAWIFAAASWRLGPSAHAMGLFRIIWAPIFLTFFILWARLPRSLRGHVIRSVLFPKLTKFFLIRDLSLPCLFFCVSLLAAGQAFNLLPFWKL